jgi:hypothetical protein
MWPFNRPIPVFVNLAFIVDRPTARRAFGCLCRFFWGRVRRSFDRRFSRRDFELASDGVRGVSEMKSESLIEMLGSPIDCESI